jgi:hypothetical protein
MLCLNGNKTLRLSLIRAGSLTPKVTASVIRADGPGLRASGKVSLHRLQCGCEPAADCSSLHHLVFGGMTRQGRLGGRSIN